MTTNILGEIAVRAHAFSFLFDSSPYGMSDVHDTWNYTVALLRFPQKKKTTLALYFQVPCHDAPYEETQSLNWASKSSAMDNAHRLRQQVPWD